jgi:hypothetical protein
MFYTYYLNRAPTRVNQIYWQLVMWWLSISDEEPNALPMLYYTVASHVTLL